MKKGVFCLVLFMMFGSGLAQQAEEIDLFDEFDQELEAQVEQVQVPDPLEPLNRGIWWMNDKLYFYALKPVATGYKEVVPEAGRRSVVNAFQNLKAPERVVNNLLQLKVAESGTELKRFVCNSTVGGLGFWDPATDRYDIPRHKEDFGQTLAHYGVKPMMTLHLPVLGPSNLRDTIGMIPDHFLYPVSYIESLAARVAIHSEDAVNRTSLHLGVYEDMKAEHLDMYRFMQDAYEQNRQKKIEE
jgi:phospholipid-binding lipoprotein MlaA